MKSASQKRKVALTLNEGEIIKLVRTKMKGWTLPEGAPQDIFR
jgi:hypothetical protein